MAGLGGSGASRRSHRHPENREAILRLLRSGNTRTDSALYVGMDPDTLRRWTRADAGFLRDCEQAEAQARIHAVAVVTDDARGRAAQFDEFGNIIRSEVRPNVSSAMWLLERRDPFHWGKRVTVDVRAIIERLATESGFSPEVVMAEVERMFAENAENARGG